MRVLTYLSWPVTTRWELWGVPVLPHGLLVGAGFALGVRLLVRSARRSGTDTDRVSDALDRLALDFLRADPVRAFELVQRRRSVSAAV